MSKKKKDIDDSILILRLMDFIRKEYPDKPFTITELKDRYKVDYGGSSGQIRRRLLMLHEAGYVVGEKQPHDNNKWVYWLPESTEQDVEESTVLQNFLYEFMNLFTMYIDEEPLDVRALKSMIGYKKELVGFLTVSRENEFPILDDELLQNVQLLAENFIEGRFTLVNDGQDSFRIFVFQVRVLSDGIYIVGLEPQKDGGAILRWMAIVDLFELSEGEAFILPEEQLKYITESLVSLANRDMQKLAA